MKNIFKRTRSKNDEIVLWKEEAERYKRMYKQELLRNQAYAHAIFRVACMEKMSLEAQELIYKMVRNEVEINSKEFFA